MKVLLAYAVTGAQVTLRLASKVLDYIGVVGLPGNPFCVVDAVLIKPLKLENIADPKADKIWPGLLSDDGDKRLFKSIWGDDRMDPLLAREQAKHGQK